METIVIYSTKRFRCIKVDLLYENDTYYYGLVINLDHCGRYFKAGSIPNDRYPNGREYPYKDNTRVGAINKALDDILEFLEGLIDNGYDNNSYLSNIYEIVKAYKLNFKNTNLQLTLF